MESKLKYLFLFFLSCGNDHLRGQSDYHFIANNRNQYPKLEIKLKKVSSNDFYVTQLKEESASTSTQTNSKGNTSLNLVLKDEDSDKGNVSCEKNIVVKSSDGKEFYIKITFTRKYQLMNFKIGIGKIYHLKNISTNLPNADIKTDYKNKILYSTYRENVVEIEY